MANDATFSQNKFGSCVGYSCPDILILYYWLRDTRSFLIDSQNARLLVSSIAVESDACCSSHLGAAITVVRHLTP